MDPPEELEQIAMWFKEEGLAPGSPQEARLSLLWRALQCTRSRLSSVTWDLDTQRSQHFSEMTEVRKSLEQIRLFTEHKDVLAREIQDENDQLKDQLQRLISLQDSQISEVAKMLYQQGLTELIHSSPSEQVAYLLVERAALLETTVVTDQLAVDGHAASRLAMEDQILNTNEHQVKFPHKGSPRYGQSPWKRLFGLHKASQSKHACIPSDARHLAGQASKMERECSRLERDLEEGSRRLAMAHNEIRRLTDELESAHLTQRAYEPELQAAQEEVEHLRQEVEKLKKYEMVELRKAKEMNDRLDLEIRALRKRVCTLDAEKRSLQQTVECLQESVEQRESPPGEHQAERERLTQQIQADQAHKSSEQREEDRLGSALQQQSDEQQRQTSPLQADCGTDSAESCDLTQINDVCRDLRAKLSSQSRCLWKKESEIRSLKQQLDNSHKDLEKLIRTICSKENQPQDERQWNKKEANSQRCENIECHVKDEQRTRTQLLLNEDNTSHEVSPHYQEAVNTVLSNHDKCKTLKKEICETLICLDNERSKNHEMKEKHKVKLCRAKQKFDDEITWRDEKIKALERELSLCSHSLAKEKEVTISITVENDKLLVERRKLLHQLNEEEQNKKDSKLTATLSKSRMDFLEMENKKLRKILHMSNQQSVLGYNLQNMNSLQCAEMPGTVKSSSLYM
ncbi:coiled-coil domain-containing protein 30 isoform X2 [Antennarius striatus]|uniref:coiled-coil domain-containing protein 30 isoform X2 n=1 Tax=Antennarius striatus TaxID=241820 RepID=UPI0035AEA865